LSVTQGGLPVGEDVLGDSIPLRLYYAYGIRNSFGFNFDPVTGNIWDAENGADDKDEINIVKPGFNSGWDQVMG
jgi:glucose/arabinose dehydrogenase